MYTFDYHTVIHKESLILISVPSTIIMFGQREV